MAKKKLSKLHKNTQIIKNAGIVDTAILPTGEAVERADGIMFDGVMVPCASYDNHFIYYVDKKNHTPTCTCGFLAGIVGYNEYKGDASIQIGEIIDAPVFEVAGNLVYGGMWSCLHFAQTGKHLNSG